MSEQLDHKTFDLIGVLSGRDYPTLEVPVCFNEAIGFRMFQIDRRRNEVISEEEAEALDAEYEELRSAAKAQECKILLKSISESVRRDVFNKVLEAFPPKKDLLGREEANPLADEEFTKRMWQVYIQKVTAPDGSETMVDEDVVEALYSNSPTSVHEAINKGIAELQVGPKAAFEQMAKDSNFLSDASPEG